MNLQDLKNKEPEDLLKQADLLNIENPSSLRKQDLMFSILKKIAQDGETITGIGVIEIMQDGFGFLRSTESNYLPGPDDIYISPSQIKKFSLRTGDSIEGEIRAPKQGERYFALIKVNNINNQNPDLVKNRVNFEDLTPLYPESRFKLEQEKPTPDWKDKLEASIRRVDKTEDKLYEKKRGIQKIATEKGRKLADKAVKKVDNIFSPKKMNPDEKPLLFIPPNDTRNFFANYKKLFLIFSIMNNIFNN